MKIQFLGAADTVTGSRHRVDIGNQRLLLDCGLFQGDKVHRERNWVPLDPALRELDAVVLSHAHLDHSGCLPVRVRDGCPGPVYATPATIALASVWLLDSAHLQEEDARRANRYGYSRHARALPLYERADAQRVMARFKPLPAGRRRALRIVPLQQSSVGHLLGARAVRLGHGGCRVRAGPVSSSRPASWPPACVCCTN